MDEEYGEFTQSITKAFQSRPPDPAHRTATTVRSAGQETPGHRGPVRRNKAQLGGSYVIEAKDLDDAIDVAARIPSARFGKARFRVTQRFQSCDRPLLFGQGFSP